MRAVVAFHDNLVAVNVLYEAVMLCDLENARVVCNLMFDARCNHRSLRFKERNRLTLHVGAHKSTVGIVVFKERNERGCD